MSKEIPQLPIRIAVLLVVLLVWIASRLSLDVLLGAFQHLKAKILA